MKKNMGTIDRSIRVVLAVIIGLLLLTGQITGVWGTVLGILAIVFLLTSAIGLCLLYLPFKISTLNGALAQTK